MKHIFLSIFTIITLTSYAQEFYDLNTIQTIEITFAQSNWDQLLDAEKAGDENYIMAQSVTINGEVFDSVGVKYKGNSTYNPSQVKNPFHIELDTYKDHSYNGYKDIKLSNGSKDPSFLREVLSYQVIRQYMDAPLSNYSNVYVNGTLIGLYANTEAVTKTFVNSRFYSKKNAFFKCNPPDGAGPGTDELPNLVNIGQDSSQYYDAYEMKSDIGWQELINLCDTLENHIDDIEKILDVDRVLWMLALDNVMVNLDSYIGGFAQNYYLYRDDNGRFLPVIWDLNESFGRFTMTGSGNLNSISARQRMTHLLNINDDDFPLVYRLLNIPMYKRMYLAHFKTILLENFDNDSYYQTGLALQQAIDAAVQADGNKLFSYNNFLNNLTSDINSGGGPGGGVTPGITNLMDERSSYLLGLSDFSETEPTISDISISNNTPVIGETITISAFIEDGNNSFLGYRDNYKDIFKRIQMYDDGGHDDGGANDGTFAIQVEITNTYMQYYIYAENDNSGKFSPQRAEHEYHNITATISDPNAGDLVINEIMASNSSTIADQDGEYDDWIELYNNSDEVINLEGYYLSDDGDELLKWAFPFGTLIDPKSYVIVWADKDEEQSGLHANFKLSAAAESLFLMDSSNNSIVDEVSFADQSSDISYGRYPNGIGLFQELDPTFNAMNLLTTEITEIPLDQTSFIIYPNPAESHFIIESMETNEKLVKIYDLGGKIVFQAKMNKMLRIEIDAWASGIYIINAGKSVSKLVIQ
jgi:hypothetical protein